LQGEAKKAKAAQAEAARKEIAELMAKAKADMDKTDKKGDAEAAQSQADDLQKEVLTQTHTHVAAYLHALPVDVPKGILISLCVCLGEH